MGADAGTTGIGGEPAAGGGTTTGGKAGQGGGGAATGGAAQAGDGGNADSGEAQPVADAFCEAARACCTAAGMSGPPDCEAQVPLQFDNYALAGEGRLHVDATRRAACEAALEAVKTSCVLVGILEKCSVIWGGTQQEGEPCDDVSQCDSSAGPVFCVRNLEVVTQSDPGVCRAPPRGEIDDPCSQSCVAGSSCLTNYSGYGADPVLTLCHEEDGLVCHWESDSGSCVPIVETGAECNWGPDCRSSDYCDSTCKPRADIGDACTSAQHCKTDLLCINGLCAPAPFATSELCGGNLSSSGLN